MPMSVCVYIIYVYKRVDVCLVLCAGACLERNGSSLSLSGFIKYHEENWAIFPKSVALSLDNYTANYGY